MRDGGVTARDAAHLNLGAAFGAALMPWVSRRFDVPLWWLVATYVVFALFFAWRSYQEARDA